jgi:hypothetical protein
MAGREGYQRGDPAFYQSMGISPVSLPGWRGAVRSTPGASLADNLASISTVGDQGPDFGVTPSGGVTASDGGVGDTPLPPPSGGDVAGNGGPFNNTGLLPPTQPPGGGDVPGPVGPTTIANPPVEGMITDYERPPNPQMDPFRQIAEDNYRMYPNLYLPPEQQMPEFYRSVYGRNALAQYMRDYGLGGDGGFGGVGGVTGGDVGTGTQGPSGTQGPGTQGPGTQGPGTSPPGGGPAQQGGLPEQGPANPTTSVERGGYLEDPNSPFANPGNVITDPSQAFPSAPNNPANAPFSFFNPESRDALMSFNQANLNELGQLSSMFSNDQVAGLAEAWGVGLDSAAALADAGFNGYDFSGFGDPSGGFGDPVGGALGDPSGGFGDPSGGFGDPGGGDDDSEE